MDLRVCVIACRSTTYSWPLIVKLTVGSEFLTAADSVWRLAKSSEGDENRAPQREQQEGATR